MDKILKGFKMKSTLRILPIAVFLGITGYFMSGAVFLLLVFGGICCVIYRGTAVEDRRFVLNVLISGFAIRVFLAVVLHAYAYTKGFHSISGDDLLYTVKSWAMVHGWEAKPENWSYAITTASKQYGLNPFTYLLAFFFKCFGFHPVAGKMINCMLGTLIGWAAYLIAGSLFDRRAAKISMLVVTFYPSLIRWSVANLKDPLMILLFTSCIYLFIDALNNRIALWRYILMVGAMSVLLFFSQIFYFLLVACGFIIMITIKIFDSLTHGRRCLKTICIILAILGVFFVAVYFIHVDTKPLIRILYMCEETQIAIAKSDDAGYYFYQADFMKDMNLGVINLPQLLGAIFIDTVYFMLTPFPWQMTSLSRVQVFPQMLLWYMLLGLAVFGFFKLALENPRVAMLTGILLTIGIVVNSLAEGNIGAAFRHRDIFTPLIVVLASAIISQLISDKKLSKEGAL